jgi:DNA-binding transcriptional ArsR family regulator
MTPSRDERIDAVFHALADPTRRSLLRRLADAPFTATELSARVPISRQAVAKHMAALHEAGLVVAERSGREVRYRLTPGPMADAATWIAETGSRWDRRLQNLQRQFRRTPGR